MRGLKRWPLGTIYTQIVADVVLLVSRPPLCWCVLGVDKTGCGTPVVDMLRAAQPQASLRPVLITAGFAVSCEDGCWHVPKRELVAALQMVLQARLLTIPADIKEQRTLEKELLAFRARITAKGNETFEADWRTRQHDDMVLATAIAVWLGERSGPSAPDPAFVAEFAKAYESGYAEREPSPAPENEDEMVRRYRLVGEQFDADDPESGYNMPNWKRRGMFGTGE